MRRLLFALLPTCLLLAGCGVVSAVDSAVGAVGTVAGTAVDVVTSPF